MNRSISMLNGYIGETVVEYWLKQHVSDDCEVTREITPLGIPNIGARGGPAIDFGILKGDVVTSLYEAKTQDYIFDKSSSQGRGMSFVWDNPGRPLEFRTSDGRIVHSTSQTKARLILLVPPNGDFMRKIGVEHVRDIILFKEVWDELDLKQADEEIIARLIVDARSLLEFLRNPTQGKTLLRPFLEQRK